MDNLLTVQDLIKKASKPLSRQAIDKRISNRKVEAKRYGRTRVFTLEQAEKILA